MQTIQDLNIQNLQAINNELKNELERYKPEFTIMFNNDEIDVIMMLNGKSTMAVLRPDQIDFYSIEEQIRTIASELSEQFISQIGQEIAQDIVKINKNLEVLRSH